MRAWTSSISAGLVGPRFEPDEAAALYGIGRGGREPSPEVLGVVERLADQGRADDLAILLDQAAIGLVGKNHLGEAGHHRRVDQPGEQGKQPKTTRRAEFAFIRIS